MIGHTTRLRAALCGFCVLSSLLSTPAFAREIVDMLGRRVSLPDRVARVYATAPPVALVVYATRPGALIGWNFAPSLPTPDDRQKFLAPAARDLPTLGNLMGHGQQTNLEALLALKPDVIVAWTNSFLAASPLEKRFAEAGVPLVFFRIDNLADYPAAFRLMGDILNEETRAATLGAEVQGAVERLEKFTAALPEPKKSVYYAESPDGLATDCDISFHSEAILRAGGDNVYHCKQAEIVGLEHVSLEEIIGFAPQIIVSQDKGFRARAAEDPRWRNVKAVGEGKIVNVPNVPFNWIDRPPSFMQALGAQYLASRFYPGVYAFDVKAETKRFYKLFLGVDISDADVEKLVE